MVGSILRHRPPLLAVMALLLVFFTISMQRPARVSAECAFPFTPTTYEDLKNRQLFLNTIELAAFNMLFPGDPYFGIPNLKVGARNQRGETAGKIPPVLLKSIGWIESSITQGAADTPFGSIGPALVSFDCGYGIAQVTSGMTVPTGENGRGSPEQALVATHFAYNIARGAAILAAKWNEAPEQKPIAGTDTGANPAIIENWYFAVWAYNGFTGPGADRSNHPMDPIYGSWPRASYSCGGTGDGKGHNRGNYPYQELVFGCAANPPVVEGRQLWTPQVITLPDLNDAKWKDPLKIENFAFPYAKMDIPSPQPVHLDTTKQPDASLRAQVLGDPKLSLSTTSLNLGFTPQTGSTVGVVEIKNQGTGVLAWYAIPSVPWLIMTPYAGSAEGENLPCDTGKPCDRVAKMQVSVDPAKAPSGTSTATIEVQALGTNQKMTVQIKVSQVVRIGVPGVVRN